MLDHLSIRKMLHNSYVSYSFQSNIHPKLQCDDISEKAEREHKYFPTSKALINKVRSRTTLSSKTDQMKIPL